MSKKNLFVLNRTSPNGNDIVSVGEISSYKPCILKDIMDPTNPDTDPKHLRYNQLAHNIRQANKVIITGGGEITDTSSGTPSFLNLVMMCAIEHANKIVVVSNMSSRSFKLMDYVDEFVIYNKYGHSTLSDYALKEHKLNHKIRLVVGVVPQYTDIDYSKTDCPVTFFQALSGEATEKVFKSFKEKFKGQPHIRFRTKSPLENSLFYLPNNSVVNHKSLNQLLTREAGGSNEPVQGPTGDPDRTGSSSQGV